MRRPANIGLAAALTVGFTASCSGRGVQPDAGLADAAPPSPCTTNAPPPTDARAVSLHLGSVNLGDLDPTTRAPSPTAWLQIGYNLDAKCTTPASTDVCTLALGAGATPANQQDANGGIDNSFGENVLQYLQFPFPNLSNSVSEAYLVTDAMGAGVLELNLAGVLTQWPLADAFVFISGGSGTLGAVMPTEGLIAALLQALCVITKGSVCPNDATELSFAGEVRAASDILAEGSNVPGQPCTAVSIGMLFDGATPFTGSPPAPTACKLCR